VESNHTMPHHAETHGFFGLFCSYAGGGVKWGMSLCGLERFRSLQNLLLAVVAVGVGAAAVAVVDGAGGGHVQSAEVVVAGALAVELAEVDVGARLGLE
jgi:hypothetical protein